MRAVAWSLVELAARLLERGEREIVLGDLVEAGESAWQGLVEIFGLVVRRQAALWNGWRPWLAALAVGLPSTFLLMGVSFSVSCTYQRLTGAEVFGTCWPTGQEGFALLLCQLLLLIIWSWTGGFVIGAVSRRTLWGSAAMSLAACAFCLARFREGPLSGLCLFLFLPPAILGIHHALRSTLIKSRLALIVALAATLLMIGAWSNGALWIRNWALIGPAWYIVVLAWKGKAWRVS